MKRMSTVLLLLTALALWPQALVLADNRPLLIAQQDGELETEDPFAEEDPFGDDDEFVASDPLERFNRGMFWFNDKLYFYALKPVARAYRIVPEPARVSVGNFFNNITSPISILNAALQFKFKDAGTQLGRLAINSTIGIGGLFDPAKKMGLRRKQEDFGQTMGRYGLGAGPYLVIPFLGPSSIRDGVGAIADAFADPIVWLADGDGAIVVGARALRITNTLSLDKDTYESIKQEQLDPYLFVRDAYLQNRAAKVRR